MRARLTVEVGAASPQVYDLQEGQTIQLGRNRQNTIVMQDQHASRVHARIVNEDNRWFIIDNGTTNGTRVNGARVEKRTELENNALITIGDTRIRFSLDPSKEATAELPIVPQALEGAATSGGESSQTTALHPDEMTALLEFVNRSQLEPTLHGLVQLALTTILRQTCANVVGFLSLDAEDPQFRIILPAETPVDSHLSKHLTQRILRDRRRVWLGESKGRDVESESLMSFRDALCIPLRAPSGLDSSAETELLGALHVYKSNQQLREREVCFCELLAGSLANTLQNLRLRRTLEADNSRLREQVGPEPDILIGSSTVMQQLRQQIARFAVMPSTVLIFGESGVGKELVALSLHRQSQRHKGPLVTVNCAAIASSLAESELFGRKKGAYTDAKTDEPGAFLRADEGTLFLDEIGEMALADQAKLLRVLESKRLTPVGASSSEIKVDVRVIAATNRDLEREMREGTFRKDLYFRLGPVLRVPPLREHLEDIPELVQHFLTRLSTEYRRRVRLSESALERLQNYSWPGNVRQLRSVLETAVAMSDGKVIHAGDLHLIDESAPPTEQPASLNLEALEAWAIRQALAQTNDNNVQAARLLGIHRDTLIAKRKKYAIVRNNV